MGNNLLGLLQQPLILDVHCKVCTHLALSAALVGNNLLL